MSENKPNSPEETAKSEPDSPFLATLPGKTLQDILSILWMIQLRAQPGEDEGMANIEIPMEVVVLAGELIHEVERIVCDCTGDNPCPITRQQIWGGADGER